MRPVVIESSKIKFIIGMVVFYLSLTILCQIVVYTILVKTNLNVFWTRDKVIAYNLGLTLYLIYNIACMMVVALSYYLIHSLNELIEELTLKKISPSEFKMKRLLKFISKIHDAFCEVLTCVSTCFTLNTLSVFTGFLFTTVFIIFSMFSFIKAPSESRLLMSILLLTFDLQFMPFLFWMLTYSSWIERDGRRTVDLMRQFMSDEKYIDCLKELDIFYQQVIHRSPFVSCVLDRINWNFFFITIGGIFSYSIILIQFYDVKD